MAVFLTTKMFFEYRGAIFWKMAAGMGDVVFAPLYQALRRRGVRFEFFHRVDRLHLSADRTRIEAVTMGARLAWRAGVESYDPLVRVGGLPCFPSTPLVDQLDARRRHRGSAARVALLRLAGRRDARAALRRGLRRGARDPRRHGADRLPRADRRPARVAAPWSSTCTTTATQAVQLWLRRTSRRSAGASRARRSAPTSAVPHVGVDAPADRRRALAGRRPAGLDRLLLRGAATRRGRRALRRRYVAEHRARCGPTPLELVERQAGAPAARHVGGRVVPLGPALRARRALPGAARSTPSSCWPTSTRRTATCSARREAMPTGSAPTRAATTTSSSPATGPTTA